MIGTPGTYVRVDLLPNASRVAWVAARSDLVGTAEAAALAGVAVGTMRRWAASSNVICLRISRLTQLYPAWQFDPLIWPVAKQLAESLAANSWAALAWLETPHGALGGRTPRAALEQGETPDRVLALASAE